MSKIIILSAGSSFDSLNNKLANNLSTSFKDTGLESVLFDNLYADIPFLLENTNTTPSKIIHMRQSFESLEKLIIFSPVFNGGFVSHLKNSLDWLSLSYGNKKYNELFIEKPVAVISAVKGLGGNAQSAFKLLSLQLSNYGLNVFDEFHLITKNQHNNEKNLSNLSEVISNLEKFVYKFLSV